MKYYEYKSGGQGYRFCYPHIDENSLWNNENLYAHEYKQIHELPIPYVVENKYKPHDYVIASQWLVSKNTMKIMEKLNKNITFFESQMYYKGEKIWDPYYTVILPHYNLMNKTKSTFIERQSSVTGKIYISKIQKLIFDAAKVEKLQEDNFFTLEEKPTRCYCTEAARKAIEEAGLTGIGFEEIPVE